MTALASSRNDRPEAPPNSRCRGFPRLMLSGHCCFSRPNPRCICYSIPRVTGCYREATAGGAFESLPQLLGFPDGPVETGRGVIVQ